MRLNSSRPDGATTLDAVRQQLRTIFRQQDVNGDGISNSDRTTLVQIRAAQLRSQRLQQTLSYDLDGDGVVTTAEVATAVGPHASRGLSSGEIVVDATTEQRADIVKQLVAKVMKGDTDGDGRLTVQEMLKALDQDAQALRLNEFLNPTMEAIPTDIDANRDGTISMAEFDAAVASVFADADIDGDGLLSQTEVSAARTASEQAYNSFRQALQRQQEQDRLAQAVAACAVPKAGPDAKIVLYGTYEGAAISNAAIGPGDQGVSVANVAVEPGQEPLYLVLTSFDAMIWQFNGAVDRVQQVVVVGQSRNATSARLGVSGLPAERVAFPKTPGCIGYFSKSGSREAFIAQQQVTRLAGKAPAFVGASYQTWSVSLPSLANTKDKPYPNAIALPTTGAAAAEWREMQRGMPGGLVAVDATKVVATSPARPAGVLPAEAGLAQLVEQGALQIIGSRRVVQLPDGPGGIGGADGTKVLSADTLGGWDRPTRFKILRKITLPDGLTGARSVEFVLGKGIPAPDGEPGHSCIYPEDPTIVLHNSPACDPG